ncbi:MAG: DUF5720 family protein [Hespellia sp.]|nr:DUF5720 family protein [Hespellia sp.]
MVQKRTIGDLLEEARRRSGAEELEGHDIMALERFDVCTRHMLVFIVLSEEVHLGEKGDKMRLFLSEKGYRRLKEYQEHGWIEIKNHASVFSGHLLYDELGHDL